MAFVTFCILGVVALIGRELLQLVGINLGAFGVVGGLVVALMGFEMLYGGTSSRTQGTKEVEDETPEEEGLIIPLAIPLMAGPGAMTTVITISAMRDDGTTLLAAGSLFFFGGGAINEFAFVLLAGVLTGTFSSIFIAGSLVLWRNKGEKPKLADETVITQHSISTSEA